VRCMIYHVRPSPCRRVQAGSELCARYRRGLGL
jgi:Fe-S-cluster containining protein